MNNQWVHTCNTLQQETFEYTNLSIHETCPLSMQYIYHIEWFDCLYQYCARIPFNRWILKYLQSKLIGLQEKLLYT